MSLVETTDLTINISSYTVDGSKTSSKARYRLKNVFPVPAIPCNNRCFPFL
tara:strand:- start:899 stop:1051 length:153 start_codon:yes stop_codon:yes gene_type:complete